MIPVAVVRYGFAVMLLVAVPPAVGLWYFIHPFARAWRKIGAAGTYAVLAVPFLAIAAVLWRFREKLIGADWGTHVWLIAAGAAAGVGGWRLARARRQHLTQRILVGVPELSRSDRGQLLTEGVYARVRNPRYLEFFLFVFAYACVANHAGTWVLFLLTMPATHLVVLIEERELRDRFGAEYDAYCRRVPRWVPRAR